MSGKVGKVCENAHTHYIQIKSRERLNGIGNGDTHSPFKILIYGTDAGGPTVESCTFKRCFVN